MGLPLDDKSGLSVTKASSDGKRVPDTSLGSETGWPPDPTVWFRVCSSLVVALVGSETSQRIPLGNCPELYPQQLMVPWVAIAQVCRCPAVIVW